MGSPICWLRRMVQGCPAAFMGIEDGSLEMLFVAPEERGKGLGKRLIQYGIENYAVNGWRSMNKPAGQRFYEHMAFRFTNGQTLTNRENPILCCICAPDRSVKKIKINRKELSAIELPYPEWGAKDLFVRDDKKRNYYLITVKGDKRVDLKEFRRQHSLRALSLLLQRICCV